MQSKLKPNQIETLGEKYRDHPLLQACQRAFACYDAEMEHLLFAPEEIFREAAIMLDHLLSDPDEAANFIAGLWIEQKRKIRRWDATSTQGDLNKITGAICFVVAATLCQHPHSFYNEQVKDLLLDEIRKNMGIDEAEETRIIVALSKCADGLDEWLMDYAESEDYLSDEIECVANGEELAPVLELTAIPQQLKGEKAESIKKKLVEAKILDDNWQPIGLSGAEKGQLAQLIAERLDIKETWKVFGKLWSMNSETLRAFHNKALDQRKTSVFIGKIQKALS